jgi:hypothetical protein
MRRRRPARPPPPLLRINYAMVTATGVTLAWPGKWLGSTNFQQA